MSADSNAQLNKSIIKTVEAEATAEEDEYEYEEILISIPLPSLKTEPDTSAAKTIKFLDTEKIKIKLNF